MRKTIALLLLLALPNTAIADYEICGNGLDDDESGTYGSCPAGSANTSISSGTFSGCDVLCDGSDSDQDGSPNDQDCDDGNNQIYPGVEIATGCTGSDYKRCQSDGTYTSCLTGPLAECATNYYFSNAGNDATGDGSYANPWRSLGMAGGGAGGGSPPSGAVTIGAGTCLYIMGSGNLTNRYTDVAGRSSFLTLSQDGTALSPIVIKQYPGATAALVATAGSGIVSDLGADYLRFVGIEISLGASATAPPLYFNNSDSVRLERVFVRDSSGNGDNNFAGVRFEHGNGLWITHSRIRNITLSTGNIENLAATMWLSDESGSPGEGHDNYSAYNVYWWDTYSDAANGWCVFFKHGMGAAATEGFPYEHNHCVNPRGAIEWESSYLRAQYNAFQVMGSDTGKLFYYNDTGIGLTRRDNIITRNTFINFTKGISRILKYDGLEGITFTGNIVIDNSANYSGEGAVLRIEPYELDSQKAIAEANGYFNINNNTYYNTNAAALEFCYYCETTGATDNEGAEYSLANWQGTVGKDTTSHSENPVLDGQGKPTAANSLLRGWLINSDTLSHAGRRGAWFR